MAVIQESHCISIDQLSQVLPTNNPNEALVDLLKRMAKISSKQCAHCHFVGPWEKFIHNLLLVCLVFNPIINVEVFRDEFLDTKNFSVGKSGRWLRRRTYADKRCQWTLKYNVSVSSDTIIYEEEYDIVKIQELLKVEDVKVSHQFVVAWYDCFRLSYKDTKRSCAYIDIARIDENFYYLLASAESQHSHYCALSDSESLSIHPRSKIIKALHHQNMKYYRYLLDHDHLGEQTFDEHGMAPIECPNNLKSAFVEFATSFEVPLTGSDDENDDNI